MSYQNIEKCSGNIVTMLEIEGKIPKNYPRQIYEMPNSQSKRTNLEEA